MMKNSNMICFIYFFFKSSFKSICISKKYGTYRKPWEAYYFLEIWSHYVSSLSDFDEMPLQFHEKTIKGKKYRLHCVTLAAPGHNLLKLFLKGINIYCVVRQRWSCPWPTGNLPEPVRPWRVSGKKTKSTVHISSPTL